MKNHKILIIGYGSIGQRHYQNLKKIGYSDISVYDVKPKNFKGVNFINKFDGKISRLYDIAFICSSTNSHVNIAKKCAKAGCHLFIEKPLSHKLSGLKELSSICAKKGLVNFVACNLRFDPFILFMKKYIEAGRLGKIYSLSLEYGRYLPYQRPKTDYKKIYASKRKMGGGIILDDIHDFDLIRWFNDFKPVRKKTFLYDKISDLKTDVEDICVAAFQFDNKVVCAIRCDYLQQYKSRSLKIIAEKGNLTWNFRKNFVGLESFKNGKEVERKFVFKKPDTNRMYIEEVKYFLRCVDKKEKTFNDVKTAKETLSLILNR